MASEPHRTRVRFTRAELESFRDAEVPDLLPESGLRLLFVGINPGLWTAAVQTHFAHPGNRFYPALYGAQIIPAPVDPGAGMSPQQRQMLTGLGIGITNLVRRATARADELTTEELRAGGAVVRDLVDRLQPRVVAFAGITAFRSAYSCPKATTGPQPQAWGQTAVWVVPNPSGLNAHHTVSSLAAAYRDAALAAGVVNPSEPDGRLP